MRWHAAGLIVGILLGVAQPCLAAPAAPMVQGLHYDPVSQRLVLTATGELVPQISQLQEPNRIVVDFPGQVGLARQLAGWLHGLKGVRMAQFQPEVGRLVFDLDQPMTLEVEKQQVADGTYQLFFRLLSAIGAQTHLQALDVSGNALQLTASGTLQPVLTQSGTRITLQVPRLKANGLPQVPLASELFQHLSATEDGESFMLQATLSRPEPLTVSLSENGRVVTLAPRSPWAKLAVQPQNETKEAVLTLSGDRRFTYQVERDDNRILLTTTGTFTEDLHKTYADGLIKDLQVRNGEEPGTTVIALETTRPAAYGIGLSEDGQTLKLTLKNNSIKLNVPTARQDAPLIVLDAGHGGNDPGAIGPSGSREAHVTLAVTRYLAQELQEMGYRTVLARHDDSEILLAPRVAVANNQKADLFISVHANALDRNWIKGIETYYRNPFSLGLAQQIHAAMVSSLKSPDRGVRYANFYVIHHTTMPSVLCEIGYITNPQEEKNLIDPAYQKRVAKAIAQGIKNYWAKAKK